MEHDTVCIDYDELVRTVNERWKESTESPDIRRLYSLEYMAENLSAMIERTDPFRYSAIINSLRGIADEARAKMREMTPKDDAISEDSAACRDAWPEQSMIEAAVAAEREACAKLCDDMAALRDSWWEARAMPEDQGAAICAAELADAIRCRSINKLDEVYE